MKIWVRNLTKDIDKGLDLPMPEDELKSKLSDGEYIIIGHDECLQPDEYDSITELNAFLLEYGDDEETLAILSTTYNYEEVLEMVAKESFTIINFTVETNCWNYGYGGNIYNEDTLGRVMHDFGMTFDWERKYPIVEEMEDDIQWENLWSTAVTTGWRTTSYKDNDYIVHR